MLVIGIDMSAAELTAEQLKFRTSLQTFLKEEGFMPTIDDEDNSLNFKKEGNLYWITFGGSSPLYIEFHRAGLKAENINKADVLDAVNVANRKVRCAKAMLNDKNISFAIEMYCHSSEEFKYIFYKCLSELDNAKSMVQEHLNGAPSTSSSGGSYSTLINKFFPIYGITLGKTTLSQAQSMGYTVKPNSSGDHKICEANGLTFWDFDKDNIFDYVTLYYHQSVPETIRNLGINWGMSYNQMIAKFKNLGFTVTVSEQPATETYQGRKTLKAKFSAKAPGEKFEVRVTFSYGNKNGEGYTTNSPNTFYDMVLDTDI